MSRFAEGVVQAVLAELEDRGGFDHWWGAIDHEAREEIVETLVLRVDTVMRREIDRNEAIWEMGG